MAAAVIPYAGATITQNLILQPLTQTQTVGSLTGQVFRADGVTPVAGIPVYTDHGGVATTDAAGAYHITGLTTGEVLVRAIDQTLLEQGTLLTTIVPDQTVTANLLLVGGTGTVNGVVQEADSTPVAGLKIYGGPAVVQTDAQGHFSLTDVPVGGVNLTVVDEARSRTVHKALTLTRPNETVSVQVVMPALGVLTGRIFRLQGGQPQPVSGLKLYALGPRIDEATTDASGAYHLENMPMGDYTISAFLPDLSDGNIVTGKLVFKDQVLRLDTTFKGKGQITGIVFDDDGVTPVGAKVGLTELQVKPGKLTPAENPLCLSATDTGLPLPPCVIIGVGYETIYRARRINNDVASGRFTFNDIFVGDFTVEAANPFSPQEMVVAGTIPAVGASVPVTLALQATGAISGTVYQPDGVTPVGANVIVQLDSAYIKNVRVQTDTQGRFTFPLISPGGFSLTAEDVDAGLSGQTLGSVQSGQTAVLSIRLLRLGSVKVTVVGANGPVPGATVTLEHGHFPPTKRTGVTQADGAVTFAGGDAIAEGNFGVQAVKDGIYGYVSDVIPPLPAGGHVEVQVTLRNDAGTVQGQFLRNDGVTPIANAQVILTSGGNPAYATTDAGGNYFFGGVLKGAFTLDGLDPFTGRRGRATGEVKTNGETVTLNLTTTAQGTVVGVVRRATDGAPLAGVEVRLTIAGPLGGDLRTTSGSNGAFQLPGVAAGDFTLSGYDPVAKLSGQTTGKLTTEGQTVTADLTIQVPPTGRVEGYITRADGTPATDVQVTVSNVNGATTTDNNGFYFFNNVPLGDLTVTARRDISNDAGVATGKLTVAGAVTRIDVQLVGTGRVVGVVTTATGATVSGLEVRILRKTTTPPNFAANALTDNSGAFTFENVPVGEVSLTTNQPNTGLAGSGSGTVSAPGATLTVTVMLEPAGAVRGRVLREDGATPAGKMAVELLRSGQYRYGSTADDGVFTIPDLKLGAYQVTITDPLGQGLIKATATLTTLGQLLDLGDLRLDTAPPTVVSLTPSNGQINVPVTQTIQVRFSEPVDPASVKSSNLIVSNAGSVITGTWRLDATAVGTNTLASFTPTVGRYRDFDRITVRVTTNVLDRVGRVLAAETLAAFTTADGTPPVISSRSPAVNAQAAPLNSVVRITYAEAVDPTKFANPAQPITLTRNGAAVAGRVDWLLNNTVIVFTPNSALVSNSSYRVDLAPATDRFGNKQTSGENYTFTTVDLVAPVISDLTSSAGNTVRVGSATAIVATVQSEHTTPDIAQVEFLVNGQSRYTAKSAPYSYGLTIPNNSGAQVVVTARATDFSGNVSANKTLTLTVQGDLPPQINVVTPVNGATVASGSPVSVTVRAQDDFGLAKLFFQASGAVQTTATKNVPVNSTVYTHTFTVNVPANATPGASIRLQVSATDSGTQASTTQAVTVTVQDGLPPTVQIKAPADGSMADPGAILNVVVAASDAGKVAAINLQVSGAATLSATYPISPAQSNITVTVPVTIPTTAVAGYPLTITAQATDRVGNRSQPVVVNATIRDSHGPTVSLALPSGVTGVARGEKLRVTLVASDEVGVHSLHLQTRGAVSDTQRLTLATPQLTVTRSFTITVPVSITAGSSLTITGVATDTSGNVGASAPMTLPILVDEAPQVAILTPLTGTQVQSGGLVTVTVRASDDAGLTQIDLNTSGGITVTRSLPVTPTTTAHTATFQLALPPSIPPGPLELQASALDTRQGRGVAAPVRLTVVDVTPPTVQITSPTNGADLLPGGTLTVTVTAADNGGIAMLALATAGGFVQQQQRTLTPARPSVTTQFTVPVPITLTVTALVTVTVEATDAAGNRAQPATIRLKALDVTPPAVTLTLPQGVTQLRQGQAITVTVAATDNVVITQLGFQSSGAFNTSGNRLVNPTQPQAAADFSLRAPVTAPVGSLVTLIGVARDDAGNQGTSAPVTLTVVAPLAIVAGLVTDANNQPIANAAVTVTAANGLFTATTGSDGRYQVTGIAAGPVTVRAVDLATGLRGSAGGQVAEGGPTVTVNVQIQAAPVVAITAPLSGTAVFAGATVAVTATVSSANSIQRVEFTVNGTPVFTATTAPYRFTLVAPTGVAGLTLGARGIDGEGNMGTASAVVLYVTPDTNTNVVGRVVDGVGNGVANATVTTLGSYGATTNSNGDFTIAGVPTTAGALQVDAYAVSNGKPVQGKSAAVTPIAGGVTNVGVIVVRSLKVWDGGGDHVSWQDAANWNDNTLPGATDDVYLPITATVDLKTGSASVYRLVSDGAFKISGGTLTLAAASQVNNRFILSSGTLTSSNSITVTGAMTWSGGTMSGRGRTVALGGLVLNGQSTLAGRTLENAGVATWTAGNISLNSGAVFYNRPGASFNMALTGSYELNGSGVKGQFNNVGRFLKTTNFDNNIGGEFNNTGSVVLLSGKLTLTGGGSNSSEFDLRPGATLELKTVDYTLTATSNVHGGGAFVLNSGNVTVNGSYNLTGTTTATGGVLTFPATATIHNWGSKLTIDRNGTRVNINTGKPVTLTTVSLTGGAILDSSDAITVTNGMTVSSGTLSGSGRTLVRGGLAISSMTVNGRTLENGGVTTWTVGAIALDNGAVFNNPAGSTFRMITEGAYGISTTGQGQFNNAGSFVKATNSDNRFTVVFNNTGQVVLTSGKLAFWGGGSNSGEIDLRPGVTLELNTVNYALTATSNVHGGGAFLVGGGNVTVNGSYNLTGTTTATGGVLTFPVTATIHNWGNKLTIDRNGTKVNINTGKPVTLTTVSLTGGAILDGSDAITVTNGMTVSSGTLSGSGRTLVRGGLAISSMTVDGRALENGGVATWSVGNITLKNGAVFNNPVGATFRMITEGAYGISSIGQGQFNNAGSFVKATNTDNIVSAVFNNTGSVVLNGGKLTLSGGGSNSGEFDIRPGATLELSTVGYNLAATSSLHGGGAFVLNSGNVTVNGSYNLTGTTTATGGGVLTFPATATIRNWGSKLTIDRNATKVNINTGKPVTLTTVLLTSGGILSSTGEITVTNGMTISSGTLSGSGRTLVRGGLAINSTATVDRHRLENGGVAIWTAGNITLQNGAVFYNRPDASFSAQATGYDLLTSGVKGQFVNAGAFSKQGTNQLTIPLDFINQGTVAMNSGTLKYTGGYTQTAGVTLLNGGTLDTSMPLQIQGGKLMGAGRVAGSVINRSLVEPGNSYGQLAVSNTYTQTGTGSLRVEIGGRTPGIDYDRFQITGTVALTGALELTLTNGFSPTIGDSFTILSFGGRSGTFTTILGAEIASDRRFQVQYSTTSIALVVTPITVTAAMVEIPGGETTTPPPANELVAPPVTTAVAEPVTPPTQLYLPLIAVSGEPATTAIAPPVAETVMREPSLRYLYLPLLLQN